MFASLLFIGRLRREHASSRAVGEEPPAAVCAEQKLSEFRLSVLDAGHTLVRDADAAAVVVNLAEPIHGIFNVVGIHPQRRKKSPQLFDAPQLRVPAFQLPCEPWPKRSRHRYTRPCPS
jgi:hypothetical protein